MNRVGFLDVSQSVKTKARALMKGSALESFPSLLLQNITTHWNINSRNLLSNHYGSWGSKTKISAAVGPSHSPVDGPPPVLAS